MKHILLLLCMTLILVSCQETKVDPDAEAEQLMELSREWAKATQARDVEACVSYWADGAILMSPGEGARAGKENLRAMVERSMQVPGFEINWEPQEAYVSKSGDLGYVIIKNYMTMPIDTLGNTQTVFNKGVEIWKKQADGEWKNVVDISNSDPTINSIY